MTRALISFLFSLSLILISAPVVLADPMDEPFWRTLYITPIGGWGGGEDDVQDYLNRMLSLNGGNMPKNIKVGISLPSTWFISSTQGGFYDYIYNPYQGGELFTYRNIAEQYDVVMGTHVNGMPWGDSHIQSLPILHNYLETYNNGINLQVDRLGRIRKSTLPQDPNLDEDGDPFSPYLEMQLTLSRYCTMVQDYVGRNCRIAMRVFRWLKDNHPDLMIFASGSSEYRQNADNNDDYSDYSQWSKAEFRDWLRGSGMYAGAARYPSLQAFNDTYYPGTILNPAPAGFPYASWDDVQPPTVENWTASQRRGQWWLEWHAFRVNQVQKMSEQQMLWMREVGLPADGIFTHQTNESPTGTGFVTRKLAAPYTTSFSEQSSNGITTYGSSAGDGSLFTSIFNNDKSWGIFEYNPLDAVSVANNLNALNTAFNNKVHILCPYVWYGQGQYQIKNTPFETALSQFIANHANDAYTGLKKHETTAESRDLIWRMSEADDVEGVNHLSGGAVSAGKYTATISGTDPYLYLQLNEAMHYLPADEYHSISFRMNLDNPGGSGQVFWFDENMTPYSVDFQPRQGWNVYRVHLNDRSTWKGKRIAAIRIDPNSGVSSGSMSLDWVRLHAARTWQFDDAEEVYSPANITGLSVSNGRVSGTDNNGDGYFYLATDKRDPITDADRADIDADYYKKIRFRMYASGGGSMQLYWWHRGDPPANHSYAGIPVAIQSGTQTYEVDMTPYSEWSGKIGRFRVDPVNANGVTFRLDYFGLYPSMLPPEPVFEELISNTSKPSVRWETPLEPDHANVVYDLQLSDSINFSSTVINESGLSGTTFTYQQSSPVSGLHWWRVRSRDAGGILSPWSVPMPLFLKRFEFDSLENVTITNHLTAPVIVDGAWQSQTTGGDPYLYFNNGGRTLAERHDRFRIRFKMSGSFSFTPCQFFFFPTTGGFSTVDFTGFLDNQFHEYTLNLAANSNWKGEIAAIRLDPGTQTGVTITIDEAEFLPVGLLPEPTLTPTVTPTRTITLTPTSMSTATGTMTLTHTPTITRTMTSAPTLTPANTATRTPTPTPTLGGPSDISNWKLY